MRAVQAAAVLAAAAARWLLDRPQSLTVDTADIVDPQVLAIPDPDDVPTGQLAKLVAPCIVFSEDKHPAGLVWLLRTGGR